MKILELFLLITKEEIVEFTGISILDPNFYLIYYFCNFFLWYLFFNVFKIIKAILSSLRKEVF